MAGESSNGSPITRRELAAELRAARAEDRIETVRAIQAAVAPVVEHVRKLEAGEFSPAFKVGILSAVDEQREHSAAFKAGVLGVLNDKNTSGWLLRSNKAAITSVTALVVFGIVNMLLNFGVIH